MPQDHFVSVLRREYGALSPSDRKRKIRELVSESQENEKFIREHFPKCFAEAFAQTGSNEVERKSVSDSQPELTAKRR